MKNVAVLLILMTLLFTGCATPPEESEYSLVTEGDPSRIYTIDSMKPANVEIEYEQSVSFDASFPFPASHRYYGDLEVRTLDREGGEAIYFLKTMVEGYQTPKGIGVGETKESFFEAYGEKNLIRKDTWEWSPDSGEPQFDEVYGFVPDDGTSNYIAFFLYENTLVMIEIADGLDGRPIADF